MPSTPDATPRLPSSANLDAEIDRCADALIGTYNTTDAANLARILDTLLRYRADREAREHRARMSGATP